MGRNCSELAEDGKERRGKHKANKVDMKQRDSSSSDNEDAGSVVSLMLSASTNSRLNSWIVDSSATSHMCNDRTMFGELCNMERLQEVILGDGHELEAAGQGIVRLKLKLANGKMKQCRLDDVLYVPTLSYNLINV